MLEPENILYLTQVKRQFGDLKNTIKFMDRDLPQQ
jgi:hypothetical protein